VPRREQPRNPVYGGAEVVASLLFHGSRVERHPNPDHGPFFPVLIVGSALGRDGGVEGFRGGGEGGAKGVTDRLEDVPVALFDGGAQDLVVAGKGRLHGRCVPLPEAGGAFYVGEQERHRPRGQAGHPLGVLLSTPVPHYRTPNPRGATFYPSSRPGAIHPSTWKGYSPEFARGGDLGGSTKRCAPQHLLASCSVVERNLPARTRRGR
jgi:hypothetical protein